MKPHGIHKSVRSLDSGRSIGDAPSLGRVSRMPGTGMPKGERRRRKRSDSRRNTRQRKNRRLVILTWTAVIFVCALGGLGAALWFWLKGQMEASSRMAEKLSSQKVIETRIASKFPSPTEEQAYELVNRALAVRKVEEVDQWIRKGSSSAAAIVEFMASLEQREGKVAERIWLSSMDANQLLIDGVLVVTRRDGKAMNRLALLTPDGNGKWQMDFDAFARTVTPPWDQIHKLGIKKAVVRVMVDQDSYYNGLYQDESKWVCYGMATPDNERVLLGYCRRDGKQHNALKKIMNREAGPESAGATARRATLELEYRFGADARQFEISRVIAEDWVVSETPFEDSNEPH